MTAMQDPVSVSTRAYRVRNLTEPANCCSSPTLKPYPEELVFSENHLLIVVVYSIFLVIGAVGNISVLTALRCDRRRRQNNRVDSFIVHLSVADLLVALLFMPLEIAWALTVSWRAGPVACRVLMIFRAFGFYLSSFVLVAISLDRYFAVARPLSSRTADDRGRMMLGIAWSAAVLSSLPQGIVFHLQSHPDVPEFKQCVTFDNFPFPWLEMLYNIFNITAIYLLPLSVIIVCYSLIVCIISRKASQLKEAGQTSNGSSVDNSRLTHSLRSLRGDRRRPCTWKWSPRSLSRPQQLRTPQRQGQSDHSDASRLPLSEDPIFVVTQRARTRDKPFYCCCCCCCCFGLPASAGQNHQQGSNKISAEAEICDLNDSRGVDDHQFLTPRSEAPLPRRLLATGRRYHQKLAPSTGLQVTADINSTSPMAVRSGVIIGKGSVKRLTLRSTGNSQIEKARAKSLKMTIVIVSVFIICWTPYYLMSAWWWFHMKSASTVSDLVQKCLFLFAVSNSCVDPIVYGFFSGAFSRAFKKKNYRRTTFT